MNRPQQLITLDDLIEIHSISPFFEASVECGLTTNINSIGGEVFPALSIHHRIKSFAGETVANITGIATGSAAIIAISHDRITWQHGAMLCFMNPWFVKEVCAESAETTALYMERMQDSMRRIVRAETGWLAETVDYLFDNQVWLDEAGFNLLVDRFQT